MTKESYMFDVSPIGFLLVSLHVDHGDNISYDFGNRLNEIRPRFHETTPVLGAIRQTTGVIFDGFRVIL